MEMEIPADLKPMLFDGQLFYGKWGEIFFVSKNRLSYTEMASIPAVSAVNDAVYGRYFLQDIEPAWQRDTIMRELYRYAKPWASDLSGIDSQQLIAELLHLFQQDELRVWQLTDGWVRPPEPPGNSPYVAAGSTGVAGGSVSAGPTSTGKPNKPKGGGTTTTSPVAAKTAGHEVAAEKKKNGEQSASQQQIDKLDQEGHAPVRHGGPNRVSNSQLEDRAVKGIDPASGTQYDAFNKNKDGSPALHKVGKNATAFNSDEALLEADNYARNSEQFKQKINSSKIAGDLFVDPVEIPLSEVFGSDYLSQVRGRTRLGSKKNPTGHIQTDFTDGTIKAIYRLDQHGNVKLHTLYPNPKP